jgi:hypothetical protein
MLGMKVRLIGSKKEELYLNPYLQRENREPDLSLSALLKAASKSLMSTLISYLVLVF